MRVRSYPSLITEFYHGKRKNLELAWVRGLENSSVVKPHCIAHLLSSAYETHFCTEVLVLSNNFIRVLCTRVTLDKLCCTDKIISASDSNAKDFPFLN